MTQRATVDASANIFGHRYRINQVAEEEGGSIHDSVLNVGYAATQTAGSGGADGTFTVVDDEKFSVGDIVTFYYDSGSSKIYGGIVISAADNEVMANGFQGALPANSTAGTLVKETSIVSVFEGDNLSCFAAYSEIAASLIFYSLGDSALFTVEITALSAYYWIESGGFTNPLAGDSVARVSFVAYAATGIEIVKLGLIHNNIS